jgi:hypothetical protein
MSAEKPKTCPCGHDRAHHMVSPRPDYTFGGWCLILIGISATPTEIRFVCRDCEKTIERVTDRKEIEGIRLYG